MTRLPVCALLALFACKPAINPAPDASDAALGEDAGPAPTVDAAPPAACQAACTALQKVGCPIGGVSGCAAFLARDLGSGVVGANGAAPVTCASVAAVQTIAQAQALGFTCAAVGH
jgi:hypothetical protein